MSTPMHGDPNVDKIWVERVERAAEEWRLIWEKIEDPARWRNFSLATAKRLREAFENVGATQKLTGRTLLDVDAKLAKQSEGGRKGAQLSRTLFDGL